jgi:hypothetical protein
MSLDSSTPSIGSVGRSIVPLLMAGWELGEQSSARACE